MFGSYLNTTPRVDTISKQKNMVEYIIRGIPEGKEYEEVLLTKIETKERADSLALLLVDKYKCSNVQVRAIDLSTRPDFINAIN